MYESKEQPSRCSLYKVKGKMKFTTFLRFAAFGAKTILFRGKKPILGTVIVTDKCNLKCKHCSVNNLTAIVQIGRAHV